MADLDPFSTKVGDVYDSHGRRVGTIRSSTPSPLGYLLIGLVIVVMACGVAVSFFKSFVNLVTHGEFVPDELEAEMLQNRDNPNYFAEYASRAKVSVSDTIEAGFGDPDPSGRPGEPYFWVRVSLANGSSNGHHVVLTPMHMRIKYRHAHGAEETHVITLDCRPYYSTDSDVPANSTKALVFSMCQSPPAGVTGAVVEKPGPPRVVTIDGRPLTGGPPNTPCYVAGCPNAGESPPPAQAGPQAGPSLSKTGPSTTTPPVPARPKVNLSYEAEVPSNTFVGSTGIWYCKKCGRGEALNLNDFPGSVVFKNIRVPAAGSYLLSIYYVSAAVRPIDVRINGGTLVRLTVQPTESPDIPEAVTLEISLNAGKNTIELSQNDANTPAIDRIAIA